MLYAAANLAKRGRNCVKELENNGETASIISTGSDSLLNAEQMNAFCNELTDKTDSRLSDLTEFWA